MFKNSSEWYTKEAAVECARSILNTDCMNIDLAAGDIFKLLLKASSEKSDEVRLATAMAFEQFVRID